MRLPVRSPQIRRLLVVMQAVVQGSLVVGNLNSELVQNNSFPLKIGNPCFEYLVLFWRRIGDQK